MTRPNDLGLVEMGDLAEFATRWLSRKGREIVTVMAQHGSREMKYVGFDLEYGRFSWWTTPVTEGTLVSLVANAEHLAWVEREVVEVGGFTLEGGVGLEPLIDNDARSNGGLGLKDAPTNLQSLMYGPIRGDVLESARFEFAYAGEAILEYRPYLFYKRRDMELRFQGLPLVLAGVLAERVSGDDSVSHALAVSEAIESALDIEVTRRAQLVRAILAELERITNHLRVWGDLAKTTTLRVGDAEGHLLEERMKQLHGLLTGHRFLRSVVTPGGVRRGIDVHILDQGLADLVPEINAYQRMLETTKGFYDRLSGTGILPFAVASKGGATGPVARASGVSTDVRVDAPYGAYRGMALNKATHGEGDAWARFKIRADEIAQSISLIRELSGQYRGLQEPLKVSLSGSGTSLAAVEATRGRLLYSVEVREGKIVELGMAEPSFFNWQVFPDTVRDTNMMDYAINEASFGLSIAGADR